MKKLSSLKLRNFVISGMVALLMNGCFTGVESTPRISNADVRRETKDENQIFSVSEENIAKKIVPPPPALWREGDKFVVCDSKISLTFPSAPQAILPAVGDTIYFAGFSSTKNILGEESTVLNFINEKSDTLTYRVNFPKDNIIERSSLDVPFAIPMKMVENANDLLSGLDVYVMTTYRYKAENEERVERNKFGLIKIERVESGSMELPLKVYFTDKSSAGTERFYLYMTPGASRTSTRNFTALFNSTDPRLKYPKITDEVWNAIVSSKVMAGMTRQECRLSIGSPSEIIHGHNYSAVYERWIYQDGRNLLFEDGLLKAIR